MESNNKYAIVIAYLTLIVSKKVTIIKYNYIEETRNGTRGGGGRLTTRVRLRGWAYARSICIYESRDVLMRHDHVMFPQGDLCIVEAPMCLNGFPSIIRIGSTLSHSRILKTYITPDVTIGIL